MPKGLCWRIWDSRVQGRDHQGDLALGVFTEFRRRFSRGADEDLLELFGQLPADGDPGLSGQDFGGLGQSAGDPMGGFEIDGGVVAAGGGGELFFAWPGLGREKAAEIKRQGWQSAGDKGVEDSRGTGNDLNGKIFPAGGADDAFAGIGDAGHAAIGYEGNGLAGAKAVEQGGFAGGFVEFLVAEKRFLEAEMLQEQAGTAGVFGGDKVGGGEGFAGAGGEVGEVSNRSANDQQAARIHD